MTDKELGELMFGNYMNPDAEPEDRIYSEVSSVTTFHSIVEQYLEEYNNINKTRMSLVIFRFFLIKYQYLYFRPR